MTRQLTSNQLKMIAIIAMFIDHFVAVFINHNTELGIILQTPGRLVAPIMCYMIAEGYYKTSSVNKYLKRLFVFAIISHFVYNLTFGFTLFQATSVMWGLFLGLFALKIIKKQNLHILVKFSTLGLCCLLAITANWNYIAVLWIVGFGVYHGSFTKQIIAFCAISIFAHIIPTLQNFGFTHEGYPHWYQFGVFLAIPFLMMYKGERGKELVKLGKYGFYIFYPAHLLFIYLLNTFTPLKAMIGEMFG